MRLLPNGYNHFVIKRVCLDTMYVCMYVCREIQELFFELEECEYEIDRIEMLEIEAVEAKRRTEVPAHIYIHTYIHT